MKHWPRQLEPAQEAHHLVSFFEEAPLYKRFPLPEAMKSGLVLPKIELSCRACRWTAERRNADGTATSTIIRVFEVEDCPTDLLWRPDPPPTISGTPAERHYRAATGEIQYACSYCGLGRVQFWVHVDFKAGEIKKVGRYPEPDISVPRDLEALLRDTGALDLHTKGRTSEEHGYGIGAFAYYRRVVERVTSKLLDQIEAAMAPEDRQAHGATLATIRAERQVETKIQLAATILPASLRPDGRNPLDVLFQALSQGLHEGELPLDDGECLDRAILIRKVLTYLSAELLRRGSTAVEFRADLDELLRQIAGKKKRQGSDQPPPD